MGVPTGRDAGRRVGWVLTLLVALVLLARGHLPEQESAQTDPRPASSALALVAAVTMLGLSVLIMAIAVVVRVRGRRTGAAGAAGRDEWFRSGLGGGQYARWLRWLPLVLAVLAVWVAVTMTLTPLIQQLRYEQWRGDDLRTDVAPPSSSEESPLPEGESGTDLAPYLTVAAGGFLVVLLVAAVVARPGRRIETNPHVSAAGEGQPSAGDDTESLMAATELGLAEIGDLTREPRDAIVACYRTMELRLAEIPQAAPQEFDTASEVLNRAVGSRTFRADSASRLVTLFAEARFSRHVMNETHRDEAEAALRMVLEDLRRES